MESTPLLDHHHNPKKPDPNSQRDVRSPKLNMDPSTDLYQRPTIASQLWALRNVLIVLLTPLALLPLPILDNNSKSHCAYVTLVMAVYWITEAVPIPVTSLIPVFLFPMIGLLKASTVSALYLNDTSLLLIGGLIVAVAIEISNFHKRLALGVMMFVGAKPAWLMAGLMGVTWFLSIWMSNTATTAMMIPLVHAVLAQLKSTSQVDTKDDGVKGESDGKDNGGYGVVDDDKNSPEKTLRVHSSEEGVRDARATNNFSETESDSSKEDVIHTRMYKAFSLSICYSANIGGIGSLTGTPPNLVLKGQADIIFADHNSSSPITYGNWLMYGLPLSFLNVVVLWLWMQAFFLRFRGFCSCITGDKDMETRRRVTAVVRHEYQKLGSISFAECSVVLLFGILVVLWITRDLGDAGGWGTIFKSEFVSDSTPAILIGFLLFVCPTTPPNIFCFRKSHDRHKPEFQPILQWQDIHEKMPWSLYLILGAGFSLARASEDSGLSEWLGVKLQTLSDLDPYLILLILCYIAVFATEITSNVAITSLMMPIVAQLAISFKVNPLFFMFPTALTTSFAFMLPVATPPNAIVFSYGQIRVIDMMTSGFFMNIICVPIVILATATWGDAIYQFSSLPQDFVISTTPSPTSSSL